MSNLGVNVLKVLLVEDNPGDAVLIQAILDDSGSEQFELVHVPRLSMALECLETTEIDLILLDLSLPDGQGLDTLRKVQSQTTRVPIVLLTGLDDETIAITALREGAQDYLVKGQFDHHLLVRSMRYSIERKRVDEALRDSKEEANRLAKENSVLAKIGRIITSSFDIDSVFESFAEEVRSLAPFDRITINTIDIQNGTFSNVYAMGTEVPQRQRNDVAPLNGSLTEEAVRLRRGLIRQSESVGQLASRYPGLSPVIKRGLKSFLTVPLISNDKVIGMLQLASARPNAYSESRLAIAESVAAQIAGVVANAQLYAEVLKTQQALKESERRYRQLIEGASDVVYTTDSEGHFLYVNDTASKFTEYSESELIGKHFAFLATQDWKNRLKRFYYRQHLGRIPETRLEFPVTTKSGKLKWIEQNVSLQVDENRITGFQAIGRDVTERKKIEEDRESLIHQLQAALAEIKTLSGMLPICASCKRIRDDKGYWNRLEIYITEHSDAELSHGICPDCIKSLYPGFHQNTQVD